MFDPTLPDECSLLTGVVMRSQLIAAITQARVDGVTTLSPGDLATATASIIGDSVHFTFAIPQGNPEATGSGGPTGPQGTEGLQGPPFAYAGVDGVTTLPAGDPASVSVSFVGSLGQFIFSIPQGEKGPPGEVSSDQMDAPPLATTAVTARNPNSISPLSLTFSDPPTTAELTQVHAKISELLGALTRPPSPFALMQGGAPC